MAKSSTGSAREWGGARPGSGRKKLEEPRIRKDVSLYLTEPQVHALEEDAGEVKWSSYLNKLVAAKADSLIRKKKKLENQQMD